ncbi:DUF2909 family protein [Neptunomonas antarctica]|uniref:Twin transmembrane helix small protein n=1 Tax=Neptunomonas antarctica TaxID=619304 RepID=A0A1N7J208_9GAMM|nr:DUF2909 family protein [Neptunomonas antarctica]SIS43373.1 Protein of unknown function [Neptunomonas antarctica]
MIKLLLLLLFIGAVVSLFSGLFFLIRDRGKSRRIIYSLYLRVLFCVLLLVLVVYGFLSGHLVSHAPWL